MHPLERYLHDLNEIRQSGAAVRETSYYPALRDFLNEVGKALKPKVRCIIHLHSQGAGIPDGGLFTTDQLRGLEEDAAQVFAGQLPARAVLEVKSAGADLEQTIQSAQVAKYLAKYGLVLVTNYRAFRLVRAGPGGRAVKLEGYSLADTERDFWQLAAHPNKTAAEQGERLADYLRRVMLANAPLSTPADVAWFLASYAREALARVEAADVPALGAVRQTLEATLGLTFEGHKGEHFFRSTLVQTLFYGVFSAWVLWHSESPDRADAFDWRTAAYHLRVPVIQALFEQLGDPSKLRALGLVEVLDWTGAALKRVDRAAFFAAFEQGQAVQYFYEPFLQAFDPVLRKQLGVWFTPPEIVQYMVARVDAVLRQELDLADGLADPRVVVLDSCAGTGAYLVEVLRRIAGTLRENGEGALLAGEVKRAALERVFGFELLPAPYVVAHLQLGLLLQTLGAPLAEHERASLYLTNSLTGWEPPEEPKTQLPLWAELAQERDAAERVKREAQVLVVLGNPPYNAFAGVSPVEEQGLVEVYKQGLFSEWSIKKYNLDDLYVRFFRLAERRIAEQTGKGVVCYISNYSYLGDPSFVVLRQRFLKEFDSLWFDSLNGDSRETGKLTPDGKPDPSVFSTEFNREGIRLGTAIGLLVRRAERSTAPMVRFRQFWGVSKRADLLNSLAATDFGAQYTLSNPDRSNRYSFRALQTSPGYLSWPKLVDLPAATPISGLQEMRKGALMDFDRAPLEARMQMYYDKSVEWRTLVDLHTGLTDDGGRFDALAARTRLQASDLYDTKNIRRYSLYPFDNRWCYHTVARPLWNEPRPALAAQAWSGNSFIVSRMMAERPDEQITITHTSALPDYHLLRPNAVAIPILLRRSDAPSHRRQMAMLAIDTPTANLSPRVRAYLAELGLPSPDIDADTAALIWMHALAIGYSPAYLRENADGIRQDWPRIPLPAECDALLASAALGKQIAALLDTEHPVTGVTTGVIRPELKQIAVVEGPTPLDLTINAGWGIAGREGITMPGKGKRVERQPTPAEVIPDSTDRPMTST